MKPLERETESESDSERIYIGGLDPQLLAVEDVSTRLRSIPGVEIVSIGASVGDKSFFFVNARRSNKTKNDESISALEIIAKLYHNVKWRGCRLSVEKAKPHFLERLALEQEERLLGKKDKLKVTPHQDDEPPRKAPRYLRIRQRYGEEAFHVDLKPRVADDWSGFSTTMHWMKKRREQYRNQLVVDSGEKEMRAKDTRTKQFLNRAVHLVFDESNTIPQTQPESVLAHVGQRPNSEIDDERGFSESSPSEDEDSSSEADDRVEVSKNLDKQPSAYVWSDDESDDSNDLVNESTIDCLPEDSILSQIEVKHLVRSPASASGSSDDSIHDTKGGQTTSLAPKLFDEFDSAIDTTETDENRYDVGLTDTSSEIELKTRDVKDDVQSNLNILSQIFPGMSNVAPRIVQELHPDGLESSKGKVSEIETEGLVQPGWEMPPPSNRGSAVSSLGLMQRYDPTKESARKYVVESESTQAVEGKDRDSENAVSLPSETSDEDGSHVAAPEESPTHMVYEQQKLETIFRQSRETEEMHGESTNTTGKLSENTKDGGAFAFSFDFQEEAHSHGKEAALTTGEQSLSPGNEEAISSSPKVGMATEGKAMSSVVHSTPSEARSDTPGIRRRGLILPKKVLDDYQEAFFALNEGPRILEDFEGFRNDRELRTQWTAERHQLTLDWKRKRKYALRNKKR